MKLQFKKINRHSTVNFKIIGADLAEIVSKLSTFNEVKNREIEKTKIIEELLALGFSDIKITL